MRVVGGVFKGESVLWWAPRDADAIRFAIESFMQGEGLCEFWSWHDEETHDAPRWAPWPAHGPVNFESVFLELSPVTDFQEAVGRAVDSCQTPGGGPFIQWMVRELSEQVAYWKEKFKNRRNRRPMYVPEDFFGARRRRKIN